MRRVVLYSSFLIALFSLIIWICLAIGQSQAISLQMKQWHFTDCMLPCWVGIVPNLTSVNDATKQISSYFSDFNLELSPYPNKSFRWIKNNEQEGIISSINLAIENNLVSSVTIGTDFESPQMPRLGDIVAVLGSPTCIVVDDRTYYLTLIYENLSNQTSIQINMSNLEISNFIKNISILNKQRSICQTSIASAWYGFKRPEKYLTNP